MSQFVNLCVEGGGVKGIAYAGALKVLEERNIISGLRRVSGTSAGSITSALIAVGAKWDDVADIVGGTNFRKFMDDSWGIVRDINRLLTDFGWHKGDAFSSWMKKQIDSFTDRKDLTFEQLKQMALKDPVTYKELYVVGSNLTLQNAEIYSAETTPHMKIWEAVRISMSIPFFFACYRDSDDDVLVDGGVTWNYPIDIFDRPGYLSPNNANKKSLPADYPSKKWNDQVYNKETLGLRVDTKDEIAAIKERKRMPPVDIENLADYIKASIGFMTDMANKAHLHTNDWHRTIAIDALGVRTTDFDLSSAKVDALVQSGIDCTNEYFAWFDDLASSPINKI